MSEPLTIARPYAKAAFEYALTQNELTRWEVFLSAASVVTSHARMQKWLAQPDLSVQDRIEMFQSILGDYWLEAGGNFLILMAQRGRLNLLLEVLVLFHQLKSHHDRRIKVEVSSAYPLSDKQLDGLKASLEKKLESYVDVSLEIDKTLLGGVYIKAGDRVFDHSLKGRLSRLADFVA